MTYYVIDIERECGEYENPMVCLCIGPNEDDAADAIAFSIEYYKEVPDEIEIAFNAMAAALNAPPDIWWLYLTLEGDLFYMEAPPTLLDKMEVEKGYLEIYPIEGTRVAGYNHIHKGRHYQDENGSPYSYFNRERFSD